MQRSLRKVRKTVAGQVLPEQRRTHQLLHQLKHTYIVQCFIFTTFTSITKPNHITFVPSHQGRAMTYTLLQHTFKALSPDHVRQVTSITHSCSRKALEGTPSWWRVKILCLRHPISLANWAVLISLRKTLRSLWAGSDKGLKPNRSGVVLRLWMITRFSEYLPAPADPVWY